MARARIHVYVKQLTGSKLANDAPLGMLQFTSPSVLCNMPTYKDQSIRRCLLLVHVAYGEPQGWQVVPSGIQL